MSRFLFHSLPLIGHVHPIAAVAQSLADRGHEVAWAGSEAFLRPLVGATAEVFPTGTRLYRGARGDRGLTAAKSRWTGYIVPVTRFTTAAVDKAVASFSPDVLAVDQHAIAGALVAHRRALPWATLAPTTMELAEPYRTLPKVADWINELLSAMWTSAGLPGTPPHDLRYSPHLVIAFTGTALAGPPPSGVEYVGPALGDRPSPTGFPWHLLDPARQRVLVTLGTLSNDVADSFLDRSVEALRPQADRVQGIIVAPGSNVPDPPAGAIVVPQVPMLELMPHLDAVVTHGGLNTVCEALSCGVPLVVAPIKSDQPINANHVVAAAAGVRVSFHRGNAQQLCEALRTVLDDPSYRAAARRVGASLKAAGGAPAAAEHLERLADVASSGRTSDAACDV